LPPEFVGGGPGHADQVDRNRKPGPVTIVMTGPGFPGEVERRRCPTLPPPPEGSTIGAGGLSFRVRNGTGRFPTAITTDTPAGPTPHSPKQEKKGGAGSPRTTQ